MLVMEEKPSVGILVQGLQDLFFSSKE